MAIVFLEVCRDTTKPQEIYANSLTLEGGKAIVNFMLRALVWALASRFALGLQRARTNKVNSTYLTRCPVWAFRPCFWAGVRSGIGMY
jgi:hypothetical protein